MKYAALAYEKGKKVKKKLYKKKLLNVVNVQSSSRQEASWRQRELRSILPGCGAKARPYPFPAQLFGAAESKIQSVRYRCSLINKA